MDDLFELRDAMFSEFGEDVVRTIADTIDFDIDIYPEMLDDESMLDLFAEMINFVTTELAVIDEQKARRVLLSAGIPGADIESLLDL